MLRRAVILVAALLLAWGVPVAALAADGPLVLAAASLQESMTAAADRWAAKGHARPVIAFAASSALARQIEAGGRADLFVSADEAWMDHVAGRGLLRTGTRATFLTNRLVLIAPVHSTLRLRIAPRFPLAPALGRGRLALADPRAVPAGLYARQALERLDVWTQVADRIASAQNVRAALMLVARGGAPLGIVYATDARAEPRVRVVDVFPAASHALITYPVAVLRAASSSDAEPFRRFLLSAEGRAIFRRFGFGVR